MENLSSVEEWMAYIIEIPMLEMITHARLIGSTSFYEDMQAEGYEDDEIMSLYEALALRFLELDMRVPDMMEGARVNFRLIANGVRVPQ